MITTERESTVATATLIAGLYVFDETVLPVFHIGGIPIKISYVLSLIYLIFHFLKIRVLNTISFSYNDTSSAKKVSKRIIGLIILSCIGEITLMLYTEVLDSTPFFDAILYYLFMLSAFGLGYACYKFNPKILYYALYAYCLLNIGLLLAYNSLPSIIKTLYGEYFAQGIRIRGTGGNANSTLLVMNCILLAIVVLQRIQIIKLEGVHLWFVFMIPIITNVMISSRGEFVSTIIMELLIVYNAYKAESNGVKLLGRFLIISIILIGLYVFVFGNLYKTNDNVRYGIDRLSKIASVTDTDELKESDSLLRPFIFVDRFWNRFIYSPIWGTGYSAGVNEAFYNKTTGYHNDWFRVLASTGIIGFVLWVLNESLFLKLGGLSVLLPVFIAGLTNTFIQSVHAFNIYFFIMGVLCHIADEKRIL